MTDLLLTKLHHFKLDMMKIRDGGMEFIHVMNGHISLIYIASGHGFIVRNGEQEPLKEGKSYFLTEDCQFLSTAPELLTVYKLSWDKKVKELSNILSIRLADQLPAKMVSLWDEAIRLQKGESLSAQCRFQSAIWTILSFLTDYAEVDQIEETMELIRKNVASPYSVATLAEKVNMTPNSFARAFKKRVGMSPKEFLIEERIQTAKALMLQNKGITTKDVAMKIGLQDEFYFSRLFKQKVGEAPTVFMKKSKERIAVVSQMFLQDHLLALGIQPVAAPFYPSVYPSSNGLPSHLEHHLQGTRLLNAEKMFKPEDILQSQPDRIFKTPLHNGEVQAVLLSHQQKVQHISLKTEWNAYFREIASLLGKENMVDKIEHEICCLESKVKDELCPLTRKGNWAVIWIRQNEIRLYGHSDHACFDLLYQKLGFEPHPDLPTSGYRVLTVEDLAALNIDKLLILWSHEKDVWKVVQSKEWKNIKAVKNREIYYPKSHEWDPWGPIGRKHMLLQFSSSFKTSRLMS
ncbi:helix-turn-helix domain-containing protein [Metabacillus endolithicus]|uniref:Helix-turn-helix domain-containing protein n=1 Tax=Metabacillus endolithicus TaxID=1535204 RepID=A0ABW5BXA6_9BACI|nr:helix-turn-helix domain-containing protein [Metabacillus endolithicus]UPG65330.1 AraC family transcriptional regulator [Metabacillus endolithicus]